MFGPLRHKKGQTDLAKQLIESILALIILIAAVAYAVAVGTDTRIIKLVRARDVAFTVEAVQASPGAVLFSYADNFGFVYKFSKGRVDVYSLNEGHQEPSMTYYRFPFDSQLKFPSPVLLGPGADDNTAVSIKKSYPLITFGQEDLSFSNSHCEQIDVSADQKKVLILYRSADESRSADDSTKRELENLVSMLAATDINAEYFETEKDFIDKAGRNPDALILDVENGLYGDYVKIYSLGDKKARRLACTTANNLDSRNMRVSVMGTSEENNLALLNPASIRIEPAPSTPRKEMVLAIFHGIKEYFE